MRLDELTIAEVTEPDDIKNSAGVVRDSFQTVAEEFNLTIENCPTHPSFITPDKLNELKSKGVKLFGLFTENEQAGFIAIEKADEVLYYIEKLAVLPEYRNRGGGERIMRFAFDLIRENGGKKVSIAIIDEHTVLKGWYKGLGFKEVSTKLFPHLPFTVCFLERDLV